METAFWKKTSNEPHTCRIKGLQTTYQMLHSWSTEVPQQGLTRAIIGAKKDSINVSTMA